MIESCIVSALRAGGCMHEGEREGAVTRERERGGGLPLYL